MTCDRRSKESTVGRTLPDRQTEESGDMENHKRGLKPEQSDQQSAEIKDHNHPKFPSMIIF